MLWGFALGIVSLMVLRVAFIRSILWRAVNLLFIPILAGLVILALSRLRGQKRGVASYRSMFLAGWSFAVGMTVVRIFATTPSASGELWTGVKYPSPDGTYLAIFYALSDEGNQPGSTFEYVSIQPSGSPLNTRDFALQMAYVTEVCLRWVKPHRLLIEIPEEGWVLNHTVASHGVAVSLSQTNRGGSCAGCMARLGGEWGQCSK